MAVVSQPRVAGQVLLEAAVVALEVWVAVLLEVTNQV